MKKTLFFILAFFTFNLFSMAQHTPKETRVLIKTDLGDITVKLYNETPLHRDNFIKLVKEGYYNGSIFHRVIKEFMIQGGGGKTGNEDPGYTVKAEFVSKYYHKKGALAAARMPDQVNPNKDSSGSQFYIVQGRTFNHEQLTMMSQRSGIAYTPEQIKMYSTVGGTPHLDGAYTVFGEVVTGLEVVDKIAAVQTGAADRPVKEVKMSMQLVK